MTPDQYLDAFEDKQKRENKETHLVVIVALAVILVTLGLKILVLGTL